MKEKLYNSAPVWGQHLACSLEGWRLKHKRFGGRYSLIFEEVLARTAWSEEQVRSFRDRRLRSFIRHCVETVPFYRRRFRDLGISANDIQSMKDLEVLPILRKDEVQDHSAELLSETVSPSKRVAAHTSGTTGTGLVFKTTRAAIQEQWGVWWRFFHWHGLRPSVWCALFGIRSIAPLSQDQPPFWRYNIPGKQIVFSIHHMSLKNLDSYVSELRLRRPPWIHGFPSGLALLAAHILESRNDLGYQVRWVTLGAENLLPHQADIIQRAFGVRPLQLYGMAEAVANFSECPFGSLHVDEDFAAVEFVPNPAGQGHKVIGTNFTNTATPLVRYDTQDLVTLSDSMCACGRPGRVVANVDGRLEDYVLLKDGVRFGRMDHIFKDLTRIREAQVLQKRPGEIVIRVVRGHLYGGADEAVLRGECRRHLGEDTKVIIEYPDRLERSENGKLRFVISELEKIDRPLSAKRG